MATSGSLLSKSKMLFRSKVHARFGYARVGLLSTIAVSLLVGVIASAVSVYKVHLLPPRLQPRALEIGAASTTVLIDTPRSEVVNLSATSDDFGSLQVRADLLGNLMATDPVKAYIARLAGIAPAQIDADAPITANVPQTLIEPGSGAAATDILASADHYKLQIQADPEVPVLHIYTQAPSAAGALRLASASVQGLRDYLHQLDISQKVDPATQVRLEVLGVPQGGVVNGGVAIQIALLTFVTAFALAYCGILAASRVRMAWRRTGQTQPVQP